MTTMSPPNDPVIVPIEPVSLTIDLRTIMGAGYVNAPVKLRLTDTGFIPSISGVVVPTVPVTELSDANGIVTFDIFPTTLFYPKVYYVIEFPDDSRYIFSQPSLGGTWEDVTILRDGELPPDTGPVASPDREGLSESQIEALINAAGHASQVDLEAETGSRTEADAALGVRIDGLGAGDVTTAQLQDEAVARAEGDTALGTRIDDLPDPNYLGVYDNLLQQVKDTVGLGDTVLRYGRYWIVHELDNARANGPLSSINDGWRAIDGQYRIDAPAQSRIYDGGDHTYVDDDLYFCRVGGNYTSAQIIASDNWDNLTSGGEVTTAELQAETTARVQGDEALGTRIDELPAPGINLGQAAAAARAITSDWAEAGNAEQIPFDKLGNAAGGVTPAELTAEITAREEGDTALSERIDNTNYRLGTEEIQRGEKDIELEDRIFDLPTAADYVTASNARQQGDDELDERIDNLPDTDAQFAEEALQRSQADVALGNRIDNLPAGGINLGQATAAARAVTADWAETNNPDPIPADKLGNVPAGGGGLNQNEVDDRIRTQVKDFAESDQNVTVPANLIPPTIARTLDVTRNAEFISALRNDFNSLPDTDAQFQEEALQRSNADDALGTRIDELPAGGINLGQATAAARAVTADWAEADSTDALPPPKVIASRVYIYPWAWLNNADPIPANKLTEATAGVTRTEVLVPFRPGSDNTKILIQSIGFILGSEYSEYAAPRYIGDAGYTLNVIEARDFAGEPHLVSLLAGGGAPAAGPVVSGDNPELGDAVHNSLIWEPTQRRLSRVYGHSAVPQVVDWGENALAPGHVFEVGKTYQGIAEHRTDLPHVIPEANVYFLRDSNTFTTGTSDGHATQYVPPGDLGAFGFKDQASNAVTADDEYAAFADPDTGNDQIFPWQVQSFVEGDPAEWHLDPYVPQSLLPDPTPGSASVLEEISSLIFPALQVMQGGRIYRFNDFDADDIRDTDEWFIEFRAADGKSGSSDNYSGQLWNELGVVNFAVQSNGDVSSTTGVSTDDSISFLAGRGSTDFVNVTGGLNTAMYIFRRESGGAVQMWIACPHWGVLFSSMLENERVMRLMRRR